MKSKLLSLLVIISLACLPVLQSCYSFTGVNTLAKSIQIESFFNNTDLGPANLGPGFTNRLKDYYQQNSSIRVVQDGGELQIEGTITDYRLSPVAPVASTSGVLPDQAAFTRLTITIKANYTDNLVATNSFKDKTFSFYADYNNNQGDFISVQESLERKIFDQILLDIFNATVATW